jgi:hypothetical protein
MATSAGNYTIDLEQVEEKGKIWNVRLYKKVLFLRKIVSSDWFLDERQAQTFARQLADGLNTDSSVNAVKTRKPGWTLVRPAR